METLPEFISRLHRAGARLWVEDGRLRVRTINDPLAPEDITSLRELKSQIAATLLRDWGRTDHPSERSINAAPLTYRQESLWRLMQLDRTGASRLVSRTLRLSGPVDITALDKSFRASTDRHEALRTTIATRNGRPFQIVATRVASPLEVIQLPCLGDEPQHARRTANEILHSLLTTPPDPTSGRLFRAKLLVLSSSEYVLAVVVHHLITDAVSIALFWNELWQLYAGFANGHVPVLPKVEMQCGDYAVWQRSDCFPWSEEYWRERIENTAQIRFPIDFPTKSSRTGAGAAYPLSLTPALSKGLRELAIRENSILGTVVLAVFAVLIIYRCRQYEFALPYQVSGRLYPQHINMMGYFAHPLLVCIRANKSDTFSQLLEKVSREFEQAQRHSDCGKLLTQVPQLFEGGLFQWLSDLDFSGPDSIAAVPEDKAGIPLHAEEYPIDFDVVDAVELVEQDIMLCLYDTQGGIGGYIIYRTDLFASESMRDIVGDLELVCEFVTAGSHEPLATFFDTRAE